jgi:hypothetical protein
VLAILLIGKPAALTIRKTDTIYSNRNAWSARATEGWQVPKHSKK